MANTVLTGSEIVHITLLDNTGYPAAIPAPITVSNLTNFVSTAGTANAASATTTQVGALSLSKNLTVISTAAQNPSAVTLPSMLPGQSTIVFNDGANPILIYPASGQAIDALSANAAVTLTNALRCEFYCVATNLLKSAKLGATST